MNENNTEVKRFVAPTMSRALELVRDEMGPEAIILSSKKVKGGIEIVTSVERDYATRGVNERRAFQQNFDADFDQPFDSDASWQSQAGIEQAASAYEGKVELNGANEPKRKPVGENIALEIERARERMMQAKRSATLEDEPAESASESRAFERAMSAAAHNENQHGEVNDKKLENMRGEIADLRMLLEQQMWRRPEAVTSNKPAVEVPRQDTVITEHLSRLGLTEPLIDELIEKSAKSLRPSEKWKSALSYLSKSIPVSRDVNTEGGGVFAFIGPTGVGKTTSLTKLAAQYSLEHGAGKVALISMDAHRVGAVEQLKALGRILECPVRTVDQSQSLMAALSSLRDFPLILIDTAGYRQGDARLKLQLDQLDQNPNVKRMLVLSSLSQTQNLKASIHAYRPRRNIDACIVSKLDEACSLGEAISMVVHFQLPVAYVTDGQQIPTDIHRAAGHSLVSSAVATAKRNSALESAMS